MHGKKPKDTDSPDKWIPTGKTVTSDDLNTTNDIHFIRDRHMYHLSSPIGTEGTRQEGVLGPLPQYPAPEKLAYIYFLSPPECLNPGSLVLSHEEPNLRLRTGGPRPSEMRGVHPGGPDGPRAVCHTSQRFLEGLALGLEPQPPTGLRLGGCSNPAQRSFSGLRNSPLPFPPGLC
ncbi:hypothetical protein NHX12_022392 [Muraenolepis orangiensis]|uniref:Uncharacterized protein n=1 Tax=Muraenolepis orangiensis TaxID=630683 RepID=A0A9Q0ITH2_9TELE|nr:hypothetical protein NHX12_022392 [Muraenolepis orangiensis]